jgi:hypothetical protein
VSGGMRQSRMLAPGAYSKLREEANNRPQVPGRAKMAWWLSSNLCYAFAPNNASTVTSEEVRHISFAAKKKYSHSVHKQAEGRSSD